MGYIGGAQTRPQWTYGADLETNRAGRRFPRSARRSLRLGWPRAGENDRSGLEADRVRNRALVGEDARRSGRTHAESQTEGRDDPRIAPQAASRQSRPAPQSRRRTDDVP